MNLYRLVEIPSGLVLHHAQSNEQRPAMLELKRWADEHGYKVAWNADDTEATAIIQEISPVD